MKYVVFQGGIGNQLFQYQLCLHFQNSGNKVKMINNATSHQGLEITKFFTASIEESHFMSRTFYLLAKLCRHGFRYKISSDADFDFSDSIFYGYWNDNKFNTPLMQSLKFRDLQLSDKNAQILKSIKTTDSVCIHVRRGDYLLPPHNKLFAGVCTEEYYEKAIAHVLQVYPNPHFFIFSDDQEWAKQNLLLDNSTFIDWNTGSNSIFDMYLMSKCKANIIANSTFSYWAARLSGNKYVYYPSKWFNDRPSPEIFLKEWCPIM